MFALLPNKKLITYETLFKKIKEIVGEPNLTQTILTNFEKAVFPHADSINTLNRSKLGDLGLQALFHQDAKFQELTYKLYSLC